MGLIFGRLALVAAEAIVAALIAEFVKNFDD